MTEAFPSTNLLPTRVGANDQPGELPFGLDLRDHVLLDTLGEGGMGLVYRSRDPALGRDLAVKIMRPHLCGNVEAESRFLREARLTGLLQHPGIVPVHNLGRLTDGRLFFTMKLVQGRTLHALLAEPSVQQGTLLSAFVSVCQAVGYAHSKGVIHRDLKTANVMVGAFGEVQVMDWGLARSRATPEETVSISAGPADASATAAGSVLGTPAFMAPEQARGELDLVDERSDVFSLGVILCVILTGKLPYEGSQSDVLRQARDAELAPALQRLNGCGADPELVALCKECLSPRREERPADAGQLSQRLTTWQEQVQARLRRAELEQAEALVRVQEERKRRRYAVALALTVLLLSALGAAVLLEHRSRQEQADRSVTLVLLEVGLLRQQAQAAPLETGNYREALAAARKATEVARTGGASQAMRDRAENMLIEMEQEEHAAKRDRQLLASLLDVRLPEVGARLTRAAQAGFAGLSRNDADELFAASFRTWGIDIEATPLTEAVERLRGRPAAVVLEIVAALDEWADERRRQGKAHWEKLAELATALDDAPGSRRQQLRDLLARDRLRVERSLAALAVLLRPVPVPVLLPLGADHVELLRLADHADPARESVLGLLTLTHALRDAGDDRKGEELLRAAVRARPREVILHHSLGQLIARQRPPRWREVIECYTASRALRPELGMALASALSVSGRVTEGRALYEQLTHENPDSALMHFMHGENLRKEGDRKRAADAYRRAIAVDPRFAPAHNDLGTALSELGDRAGAVAAGRTAVALSPNNGTYLNNLAVFLYEQGNTKAALEYHGRAIAVAPNSVRAHYNHALTLESTGDSIGAINAYRRALECDLGYAPAHHNLANQLYDRNDLAGAARHYQAALIIDASDFEAWTGYGLTAWDQGDAERAVFAYRRALQLNPRYAIAWNNLGNALRHGGDVVGAVAAHRQAVAFDARWGLAHLNLARALFESRDMMAARASCRQAVAVVDAGDPLRADAERLANRCDYFLSLEAKLSAVLDGKEKLAEAADALVLAGMCERQKRYVPAARLYASAFKVNPRFADNLPSAYRSRAAVCAVRAAETEKDAAALRQTALNWLRADLEARQKHGDRTARLRQTVEQWCRDPQLAGVRTVMALEKLPAAERADWQGFWHTVLELHFRGE